MTFRCAGKRRHIGCFESEGKAAVAKAVAEIFLNSEECPGLSSPEDIDTSFKLARQAAHDGVGSIMSSQVVEANLSGVFKINGHQCTTWVSFSIVIIR